MVKIDGRDADQFSGGYEVGAPRGREQLEGDRSNEQDLKASIGRILADVSQRPLVVFCAECGMGKSYAASMMMRRAREADRPIYEYHFDDVTSDVACRRLVRMSRRLYNALTPEDRAFVLIDGITPPDEAESDRETRAINRLVGLCAQVVICIRPESEQLLEHLKDATCLRSEDLLLPFDREEGEYECLTGGIPNLVAAKRADEVVGTSGQAHGSRYLAALGSLAAKSLRHDLPDEEVRLRLAMMLLGHGTLEELALVSGRCDKEMLGWVERDAPFFGASVTKEEFRCSGLWRDDLFERILPVLHEAAAPETSLVVRACGVLSARGDAKRSALACRLCASEQGIASIALAWGVDYVGVGEIRLVKDALAQAKEVTRQDVRSVLSDAAVAAIVGSVEEYREAWTHLGTMTFSTMTEERLFRRVGLYGACREVWIDPRQASQMLTASPGDRLGITCLAHLRSARLLAAGRFDEAYVMATNEMQTTRITSIPDVLLHDDELLGLTLGGGMPEGAHERLAKEARQVLAQRGLRKLRVYHDAICAMPEILMSDAGDSTTIDEAVHAADKAGDRFFQALCLAVCAVADIRAHALSHAHVRAQQAADIAKVLDAEYLTECAEFLDALALSLLGDKSSMGSFCTSMRRTNGLLLLGRMAARALGQDLGDALPVDVPFGMPCPKEALWALNLLMFDCPSIWDNMVGILPAAWCELMRSIRYRRALAMGYRPQDEIPAGPPALVQGDAPKRTQGMQRGLQTEIMVVEAKKRLVHVSILGGFAVECDGKKLPQRPFERRRARELITLLSIVPGHKIRRYQAIEILWPDDDYFRGPRKLYEATGELRKILKRGTDGRNLVLSDRVQGSVGLDPTLISCDVDDFEREARIIVSEDGNDLWVLEHARRMERLYAGGPDEQTLSMGDMVRERCEELAMLYVDGAIAAGEAALRLGKAKLAVRYAMDAHRLQDLREDAVILLVRALRSAGRAYEIPRVYRRFSQHLIETQGIPPSIALRRAVEIALGDGANGAGGTSDKGDISA